jgi:oxygen-independent coproporphyrinogen III oxidase
MVSDIQSDLLVSNLPLTEELLLKYSTHGPRYTSYPTAPVWKNEFGPEAFNEAVLESNAPDATSYMAPLSLYTHLPFCESRCLFCGCNVVITRNHSNSQIYLDALFKEMEAMSIRMNLGRGVNQFHWGGGTPTFLSPEEMEKLFRFQKSLFNFEPHAEIAIEVDPRVTTDEQLVLLRELGFNRISLGLQDLDPTVQETINRIQPRQMTETMVHRCRELGFESLNLDLIYGLPHQTQETFQSTVDAILEMSPDRIALYHYAHVPWMAPHQKHLPEAALPDTPEKIQIFMHALNTLTEAGYVYIGMDHFAKPTDELTLAQKEGTLKRNFMGYTTRAGSELMAFGVSAISGLFEYYGQNQRNINDYYAAVNAGQSATMRGYALSEDDIIRREVIMQVLCHGTLNYETLGEEFGIKDVKGYFAPALATLNGFEVDGLLVQDEHGFSLTPIGRILSRNVVMGFDAYLKPDPNANAKPIFSKTI